MEMEQLHSKGATYLLIGGMFIVMISGFYFLFQEFSNLRELTRELQTEVTSLKTSIVTLQVDSSFPSTSLPHIPSVSIFAPTSSPSQPSYGSSPETPFSGIVIPTAITFNTTSSPLLLPQAPLTVAIQGATKSEDGILTFSFKVFTYDTASYSALEVRDLFQRIRLSGPEERAMSITGTFTSMPPKGAISGTAQFRVDQKEQSFIFQIGPIDDPTYYEFDFSNKTYKETTVG